MIQLLRRLFLTLLFLTAGTIAIMAQESDENGEGSAIDIMGQVADHDHLTTPFGSINLPRLYIWRDEAGSLKISGFASTHSALNSELFTSVDGEVLPVSGNMIIDMSVSSHLFFFWLSLALVLVMTLQAKRLYTKGIGRDTEPRGAFQNIFEVFFIFIRDDVAKPNIPGDKYMRYMPYLFTAFLGISFMNAFGLLPWAATATADITVTAVLAFITFLITQFSGSKHHWQHVFWYPDVPIPIKIILIPVEIMGLFTKPFALAIRLFANMMSGKILIISILGLIFIFNGAYGTVAAYGTSVFSVALASVLYILKLFVALLQAYIFTLLSAVFIGMAIGEEEHEEHNYAEQKA